MRFATLAAIASLGGLLFGYDTGVISGALLFLKEEFALTPLMQGVTTGVVLAGATVGAACGGALADRYGRKAVIIATAALFSLGALFSALAPSLLVLIGARAVVGLAIGITSMLTPLYLAELAPAEKRGAVVSFNQFCITSGILLSYLVDYLLADVAGGWRWMLGVGLVPGVVLGGGMLVLPESPRWLLGRGRAEEAAAALHRLRGGDVGGEIDALRRDLSADAKAPDWSQLLRPGARRALIVGFGLAVCQQITGINTVIYYAPIIFQQAGLASAPASLAASAGLGLVNVIITVVAIRLLDRAGRRLLLLSGLLVMGAALIVLGAVSLQPPSPALGLATAGALAVYVGGFAVGLGPVFWLLIAEVFPLAVRGRGMSVASVANWGANVAVTVVFLDLVRLVGTAGIFLLFAVLTAAAFAFAWGLVPETRGRSLEEIEAAMGGAAPGAS